MSRRACRLARCAVHVQHQLRLREPFLELKSTGLALTAFMNYPAFISERKQKKRRAQISRFGYQQRLRKCRLLLHALGRFCVVGVDETDSRSTSIFQRSPHRNKNRTTTQTLHTASEVVLLLICAHLWFNAPPAAARAVVGTTKADVEHMHRAATTHKAAR